MTIVHKFRLIMILIFKSSLIVTINFQYSLTKIIPNSPIKRVPKPSQELKSGSSKVFWSGLILIVPDTSSFVPPLRIISTYLYKLFIGKDHFLWKLGSICLKFNKLFEVFK